MRQHWNVSNDSLEISEMPFYWRLSQSPRIFSDIVPRLPVKVKVNSEFDYLELEMSRDEWCNLERAYKQNENIGFINPESGQINTYGSSVNNFFLDSVQNSKPGNIFEIGCGAGFSIMFMRENGWRVTGIDPSEYSLKWSKELNFELINGFFDAETLTAQADFIFCNDVFEHIRNVPEFSKTVFKALKTGGTFCFSTTNSTESITLGDISMFEHQHVNMFTERSIHLILKSAGFSNIHVGKGSYGNTFQVTARKGSVSNLHIIPSASCEGYFNRAARKIEDFNQIYQNFESCMHFYVPLRCIPYLATVGDFGKHEIFDSNKNWKGKYIDGYSKAIQSKDEIFFTKESHFFVGSMTFHEEIKNTLISKGFHPSAIHGIKDLG